MPQSFYAVFSDWGREYCGHFHIFHGMYDNEDQAKARAEKVLREADNLSQEEPIVWEDLTVLRPNRHDDTTVTIEVITVNEDYD